MIICIVRKSQATSVFVVLQGLGYALSPSWCLSDLEGNVLNPLQVDHWEGMVDFWANWRRYDAEKEMQMEKRDTSSKIELSS